MARILIVDDHGETRTAIRPLLDLHALRVCDEASSGKEAIEKVRQLRPGVILLNINVPEMNGVQAAYKIRRISDGLVSKSEAQKKLIPTLLGLIENSRGRAAASG
jgi:chemotaxis response regulator CheB